MPKKGMAMFECVQVGENTYYIANPVNVGLYIENGEAWIIDTGIDARVGKKIIQRLNEHNWKPKAIINTHCHVDHVGANAWLQKEYNIPIYSNGMDRYFIEHTVLSAMALWGAFPPKALQGTLFTAEDSKNVQNIYDAPLPKGFEIIPFSGHSLYMFGVRTPDNIVFTADEFCNAAILDKYKIAYNYCVELYYKSLEEAEKLEAKLFVPAHGEPFTDIKQYAAMNRKAVLEVHRLILEQCRTPQSFDMLLQCILNHYKMNVSFAQHVIVGSTIRSYLSWLLNDELIEPVIENNMLYWQTK